MANNTNYGYLISPAPQFLDSNGNPIAGGKLKVYIAGTTTKATTYSDWGLTKNTWPIVLDSMGTCQCIVNSANLYKFVLESAEGEEPLLTRDNISVAYADISISGIGSEVVSSDDTVAVESETDEGTGRTTYDISIAGTVETLNQSIAAAKTEVVAGGNIEVEESTDPEDGHSVFTVSGVESVPNVSVTSEDGSVNITESTSGNNKTFDLSVVSSEAEVYQGTFSATIAGGSIDTEALGFSFTGQKYQINVNAAVSVLSAGLEQVNDYIAVIVGGTAVMTVPVNVDESVIGSIQVGRVSFCLAQSMTGAVSLRYVNSGTVSKVVVAYVSAHSVSGGSGSASGDNDKVAVNAGATADYLENVLVSASDLVTLAVQNGKMYVNVNTEYSSDPKLVTMDESEVNSATSNYGSYNLNSGYSAPVWDDTEFQSYSYLNAIVYQMTRLSDAQGTITKASLALCGTFGMQDPPPCFNVGIFSLDGTLLGQSGLKVYGVDFTTDEELISVDMNEESSNALSIERNTRYIVQLWSCGLQFAAFDRSTSFNYAYDFTLRQNMQGSVSQPCFSPVDASFSRATQVPYIVFGADPINSNP